MRPLPCEWNWQTCVWSYGRVNECPLYDGKIVCEPSASSGALLAAGGPAPATTASAHERSPPPLLLLRPPPPPPPLHDGSCHKPPALLHFDCPGNLKALLVNSFAEPKQVQPRYRAATPAPHCQCRTTHSALRSGRERIGRQSLPSAAGSGWAGSRMTGAGLIRSHSQSRRSMRRSGRSESLRCARVPSVAFRVSRRAASATPRFCLRGFLLGQRRGVSTRCR